MPALRSGPRGGGGRTSRAAGGREGGKLSCQDYDDRAHLHVAFCEGHLKLVKYGATVYAKGRCGATPLRNAVQLTSKKAKLGCIEAIQLTLWKWSSASQQWLETPKTELYSLSKRKIYAIPEYAPLLNSCNMTVEDLAKIAKYPEEGTYFLGYSQEAWLRKASQEKGKHHI